jgi:hypothetical protein
LNERIFNQSIGQTKLLFVDMFFGGGFPFGFQQGHHDDNDEGTSPLSQITNSRSKTSLTMIFLIADLMLTPKKSHKNMKL